MSSPYLSLFSISSTMFFGTKSEPRVVTNIDKYYAENKAKQGENLESEIDISLEDLNDSNSLLKIEEVITKVLKKILKKEKITPNNKGLIVGLGNLNITPDSLGPKVIDKVIVTRHLFELDNNSIDKGISNICALSPGVMGTTGIETCDIIKALVEKIEIDYIIVVDALKASSIERVNKTIQLTNSGISPGSGVGNKRKELSKDTLGIPVIAIGVPTVVDSLSIALEFFNNLITNKNYENIFKEYNNLSEKSKAEITSSLINYNNSNLIVSLKEIDIDIENFSEIISGAIDHAVHEINT